MTAYLSDTFVPALDDLALADSELEWSVAITRRIELLAVGESACRTREGMFGK